MASVSGDPNWLAGWRELELLHRRKSSTYGTEDDALANFVKIGEAKAQDPEVYVLDRMMEKLIRCMHMLQAGDGGKIEEWPDLASLALCAEALRRRRG